MQYLHVDAVNIGTPRRPITARRLLEVSNAIILTNAQVLKIHFHAQYNPLTFPQVSTFLDHLQGVLHQANTHANKTQKSYQICYKFMVFKFADIVKFAVKFVCRFGFGMNVIQCTQILPRI